MGGLISCIMLKICFDRPVRKWKTKPTSAHILRSHIFNYWWAFSLSLSTRLKLHVTLQLTTDDDVYIFEWVLWFGEKGGLKKYNTIYRKNTIHKQNKKYCCACVYMDHVGMYVCKRGCGGNEERERDGGWGERMAASDCFHLRKNAGASDSIKSVSSSRRYIRITKLILIDLLDLKYIIVFVDVLVCIIY